MVEIDRLEYAAYVQQLRRDGVRAGDIKKLQKIQEEMKQSGG